MCYIEQEKRPDALALSGFFEYLIKCLLQKYGFKTTDFSRLRYIIVPLTWEQHILQNKFKPQRISKTVIFSVVFLLIFKFT